MVIWSTGFDATLDWMPPSVFDEARRPLHERGVTVEQGINCLGFPWLSSRKSGIIYGVDEDAAYIADQIVGAR